jgi:allantoinase
VIHGAVDAGWELNAHGYEQMPMHKVDDQLAGSIRVSISSRGSGVGARAAGSDPA